ncbi:MAG: flagellar export chaperone FlgN [Parashewanella sp.]
MLDIDQTLEHQLSLLAHLTNVINDEKVALTAQNAEQLLSLAQSKSECLTLLKQNDELLSAPENAAQISASAELTKKAQDAKQRLIVCQELNQENAHLIEHNIASLNRLSHALQTSRNSYSMTYDDKGRTSTISTLGQNLEA